MSRSNIHHFIQKWSKTHGIAAVNGRLKARTSEVLHCYVIRHDCNQFLADWWLNICRLDSLVSCAYAAKMSTEPFKCMIVIRSKVVDIKDRRNRGTWDKIPMSVKAELVTCPTTPDNIESSWNMAIRNADYRR